MIELKPALAIVVLILPTLLWAEPGDYGLGQERVKTRVILRSILTGPGTPEQKLQEYKNWEDQANKLSEQRTFQSLGIHPSPQTQKFLIECPLVLANGWYCMPPAKLQK